MEYLPMLIMTVPATATVSAGLIIAVAEMFGLDLSRRTWLIILSPLTYLVMRFLSNFTEPNAPGWLIPAMLAIALVVVALMPYTFGEKRPVAAKS